jgi:hypothetical protein
MSRVDNEKIVRERSVLEIALIIDSVLMVPDFVMTAESEIGLMVELVM